MPAIIITQIEPMFILSRMTFVREASSRMYSPVVFAIAQMVAETPYSILCAVAFFVLQYYPSGFPEATSRAGYYFAMILVTEFYSVTLGQAIAALSPSIFIAATANPFLLVMFSLFCGVTVPPPQLPQFWLSWMYRKAFSVAVERLPLTFLCFSSILRKIGREPCLHQSST